MGNCCVQVKLAKSRISIRKRRRRIVLLLVGLDNSGKTAAAKGLIGENNCNTVPTVGFSIFTFSRKGYSVVIYDLGGGHQIRDIWAQYFVDVHGVVYVIDASDSSRINESRTVLQKLLTHENLKGKPLLLLANKQDVDGALDEIDVVERLNLEAVVNEQKCPTLVETCSAVPQPSNSKLRKANLDLGIQNGFEWILNIIIKDFHALNSRVEKDIKVAQNQLMIEKENRRIRVEEQRRQREEIEGTVIIPLRDSSPESFKSTIVTLHSACNEPDTHKEIISRSKIVNPSDSLDSGYTVQNGDRDGDSLKTYQSHHSAVQSMVTEKVEDKNYFSATGLQDEKQQKLFKKGFMRRSNKTAPAPGDEQITSEGSNPFVRRKLPPLTPPPNRIKMFEAKSAKRARLVKSMSLSFDKTESDQTDEERSINLVSFPSDLKLLKNTAGKEDVQVVERATSDDGFGKTFIFKR